MNLDYVTTTRYVYILPWAVTVCVYALGGAWTVIIIAHKRLHLETLTVQQQNAHVMVICGYLAVFLSHYAMQVGWADEHNYSLPSQAM